MNAEISDAKPRAVVLGGTGLLGRQVAELLRRDGWDVVAASRSSGVDAYTGVGLDDAFRGAVVVVDCLNHQTISRRSAVDFFTTAATNIAGAAGRNNVRRIVCVSIVRARDRRVHRALGYYAGKAAQEFTYRAHPVPLTMVRTTQWFELAETFLDQLRLGPVSFVLGMRSQPLSSAEAAAFVAQHVMAAGEPDDATPTDTAGVLEAEIAGPEVHDLARLARQLAARGARRRAVVRIPLGRSPLAGGGLLPRGDHAVAETTFAQWLAERPLPPA